MHLESFTYDLATRSWSVPALPHLDAASTLVLAFGSPDMVAHPRVFQLLRDAYPSSSLIGCSSAGVIAGAEVRDRALSVVVAKFERTKLRMAATLVGTGRLRAAGEGLARKLLGPRLRALLVLAEGLRIDGDALVTGIRSVVGEEVVVAGGLAGDDVRFERTWVCSGNHLQSGLIAAVGFYGDELIVGCGSESGWDRFGPERQVTRADGNTLYELDGAPAAEVYKRYLGPRMAGLPAAGMLYPLALWPVDARRASGADAFAVRPLLAADEETGALVFAGSVPEGHRAQLMRTDADRLLHSAVDAALAASRAANLAGDAGARREPGPDAPAVLGIAIGGLGRRLALGERADEELKAARRALPPGAVTAGFYGYGEIAPDGEGRCRLQHQSMTVLLLGEPGRPATKEISAGVPVRTASTADSGPQTLSQISLSARPSEDDNTVTGVSALGDDVAPTSGFAEVTSFMRDLDTGTWSVSPLPALDSPRTLVLVFASSEAHAHPRAFADLRLAYPKSHIIGCSTAGEILGLEARSRSMVVAVMRFAHTELASAQVALGTSRDGAAAGSALGRELAGEKLRGLLVFSSAPAIAGEALLAGLRAEVGPDVAIAGAMAAGGARGEYSWVLARGTLARQAVTAVALYGDHVILGHGACAGWSDLGPARTVTRSQGGVLLELDGRPALHFYREALGASKGVPGPIPVALTGAGAGEGGTRRWRVVLAMDDRQHALTLAGGIPPASRVQLVRTSVDQLLGSAAEAAQTASKAAGRTGPNALGLLLGNTVRHTALGERAASEIEAVASALGGVRMIGCYARGAVSSLEDDESALAVTVLGESPAPRGTKSTAELTAEALAAAAAAADAPWLDPGATAEPTRTVAGLKQAAEQARTGSGTSAGRPLPPRPPPRPAPKTASSAPPAASVPVPVPPEASGASSEPDDEPAASFAIASFTYDAEERRWSVPSFPELDSPRTMVLAFGAPELASTPEVFTELRQAYPRAHVLGCSTAGEIAAGEVRDRSLAVAVVRFARTELTTASVVVGDTAGSFPAGQVLAHKLNEPGLRAIVLLAEGLEIGGSELLRGIKSVIDDSVVITGGLAGDGLRFQRTWVLSGDAVQGSLVTAVGLYGDYVCVGQGAEGGWQPHGPAGTVKRSSGNVLHEIDGRPALAWYKERLGPHAAGLPATGLLFPLGIELGDGEDAFLARTVMAIDEGQESMTLAGDAPQGRRVRVLAATSSQLADGAREAAELASDELESVGENALGLLVSAVGRRVVLGDGASAELAAARAVLPEGVTTAGFYGYGGFAAYRGRATELHNQTFLATVIAESEEPLTRPTAAALSASESVPRSLASASAPAPMHTHRAGHAARRAAQQQPELTHRDAGGVRIIELGGRLDESFDGRAVASLVKSAGITVLDLAHVERVSSYGVREWLQMMEEADTEALYLARCAEPLVNQLMLIRAMLGHAVVISFAAPYVCKTCDHAFVHMLDCERDAAAIAENRPPDVPCARCGRAARFDDDPEAYRAFFEPHLGQPIPAAVRRALAPEETTGARTAEVMSAMALGHGRAGLPALRVALLGAVLGALATALLVAGVYWFALRPRAAGGGGIDPAAASTQDAGAGTAGKIIEAPRADLPAQPEQPPRAAPEVPAWVDRGIDIQEREILVAGRSGTHADLHGAMAEAYRVAVHELLVHVMERLQGAPVYGYLRTHVEPALAADAPAGALERVLARYEAQMGASALPERVASFPVEREGSVSVTAWYRLPRDEFERILAHYQAAVRALDMTVVTVFPLLAASQTGQGDVLVLEVAPGSAAQRAGVAPGDVIVRVGDRYVSSPEEYAAAAKTAWESTRSRRSLELELVSRGQRVVRSLKKR